MKERGMRCFDGASCLSALSAGVERIAMTFNIRIMYDKSVAIKCF